MNRNVAFVLAFVLLVLWTLATLGAFVAAAVVATQRALNAQIPAEITYTPALCHVATSFVHHRFETRCSGAGPGAEDRRRKRQIPGGPNYGGRRGDGGGDSPSRLFFFHSS